MPHREGSTDPYLFRNAYLAARSDMSVGKDRLNNPKHRSKQDKIFFAKPAWEAGYGLGVATHEEPKFDPDMVTQLYYEWAETNVT